MEYREAPEKMKLKQLEGLLGDLEQFSNPKVCYKRFDLFFLLENSLLISLNKICIYLCVAGGIGAIPNWSSHCFSHAFHCKLPSLFAPKFLTFVV